MSRARRPPRTAMGGSGTGGEGGFQPRVEDHTDPGFALTLHTPAVVSRLNHCGRVSETALDRMLRAAAVSRRRSNERPREAASLADGSESGHSSSGSEDEEDEEDRAHRVERRRRGGMLAMLGGGKGAVAARSGPSGAVPAAIPEAEHEPEPDAPLPAYMAARRGWGDWRPFMVNAARCPERRFSVGEAALAGLSGEQRQAVFLLEAGLSCFVTGPGGTGKSQLIRVVREAAEAAGLRVRVTASTGIAARNIGGTTLHRVIGWGLMRGWPPAELGRRVAGLRDTNDGRIRRWAETDLLIVDEISMLSIATLQQADAAARAARERSGVGDDRRPFGGIQLLFLGDFAQLTMGEEPTPAAAGAPAAPAGMAFSHPAWAAYVPFTVELRTIFRQRDAAFRDLLNRVRLGRPLRGDILTLNAVGGAGGCSEASHFAADDEEEQEAGSADSAASAAPSAAFPDLCAFRVVAAELNAARIGALRASAAQAVTYAPRGTEAALAAATAQQGSGTAGGGGPAEPIEVCVGARVLLTKNLDQDRGLVNGALGEVVGFAPPEVPGGPYPLLPVVRWEGIAEPHAVPHATWEPDEEEARAAEPQAKAAVSGAAAAGEGAPAAPAPAKPRKRPRKKAGEQGEEAAAPNAVQYMPLLCAWALTVHRAQGMTLSTARIHGASMRTPALLYTALSRLRGMDGLRIRGTIAETNVVALPEVVRYYDALHRLVDATAADGGEEDHGEEDDGEDEEEGEPGGSQLDVLPPSQGNPGTQPGTQAGSQPGTQAGSQSGSQPGSQSGSQPGQEREPGEPDEGAAGAPAPLAVVPSEVLAQVCAG
jgi:ATP-dependent DNA helicase PIF1